MAPPIFRTTKGLSLKPWTGYDSGMQTLDFLESRPDRALSSPAARRNTAAILKVLRAHAPAHGRALEIASGTGEHAAAFAAALSGLNWTPSDPSPEARASIDAWRAQSGLANLGEANAVDCLDETTWPKAAFDVVFCANMAHISPWEATEGLMRLANRVLRAPGGLLALYGPYLEADVAPAPSNVAFDVDLKARDAAWGLRDRDAVIAQARSEGVAFTLRVEMPANNLMLLFRRM